MHKVAVSVRELSPEELLVAYKPEEVWGHCANCGNHGRIWSCPPHRLDPIEFIKKFSFAYLIVATVSLAGFHEPSSAIKHYYAIRRRVNRSLLKLEATVSGSVGLYAGHCEACEACVRFEGLECIQPGLCRYSLESLGLKVSGLTETHFGENLQWAAGETPEKLLVIPALLSPETVAPWRIVQALENGLNAIF